MAPTLTEEDAWRAAMAAGEVLTGRVSLVEAPLQIGSIATQYECIDVKVYDPMSHAFAQLPTSSGLGCGRDYASYARSTRAALAVWAGIARYPGFSVQENAAFWVRLMRQLTPHANGRVSDAPPFVDTPGARFPRFRLTFLPKDCYDEDQHDDRDAIEWVNTFCNAFFQGKDSIEKSESHENASQLPVQPNQVVPVELVFRVPVMRTHGPLGSALEQHRAFIGNTRELASRLTSQQSVFNVTGCKALLRGTIRLREFTEIAHFFDSESPLRLSELCLQLDEELAIDELRHAIGITRIPTVVTNVSRASPSSLARLFDTLQASPSIRTLRLFNAFDGSPSERHEMWKQLSAGIHASHIQELVLERMQLDNEDLAAMREHAQEPMSKLTSMVVKPMAGSNVSAAAYVDLIKLLGRGLTHADLSALCLQSGEVDTLLDSCPRVRSLRLGQVEGLTDSRLCDTLRQRSCPLASLAVSCSENDARSLSTILADQPLEVALSSSHLTELSLTIEAVGDETSKALLYMLDTNHSLRCLHLKRRGVQVGEDAIQNFAGHHNRQLVRKLPMAHKAAFLSVLDQTAHSSLHRFDAGIASEILGFAGHAVHRQFHCSQ